MILHIDAATVAAVLVSTVIPLLSSLLSKAHWPAEIAGLLTLLLSTGDAFFAEWAKAGDAFDWHHAAGLALLTVLGAFQFRSHVWAGSSTDAAALTVGSKVAHAVKHTDDVPDGELNDTPPMQPAPSA